MITYCKLICFMSLKWSYSMKMRNNITREEKNAIVAIAQWRDMRIAQVDKALEDLKAERSMLIHQYSGAQLALQFDTTTTSISHITKGRK